MLSYQHDYHAGNHADVLKHWLLVECVEYLQQKPAGFEYIDTHAGAGWYRLDSALALKNREFEGGIARLLEQPIEEMESYLRLVREPVAAQRYPGSPGLVNELLRPQDRSWLFELHPQAFAALEKSCARKKQTHVRQQDGFKALLPLLPVASRRALVLIDPAYEVKADYQATVQLLQQVHKKMPQATCLLWYPLLDAARNQKMQRELDKAALPELYQFELALREPLPGAGMTGSGVFILNPPWTLKARADSVLPRLAALLADDGVGRYCSRAMGN